MKRLDVNDYLKLIETRLDIMNLLIIKDNKIIPNSEILNKKFIKDNLLDDLFEYHNNKLVFKNRFMNLVSEITDRKVLAGHYYLELRDEE